MICGSCRIWAVAAGAFLAVSVVGAAPAHAQSWPQRPVKLILTLGRGSGTDIGMRLLADRLPKVWNQPVVIENRPGGDGIVAITSFLSVKRRSRSARRAGIVVHRASLRRAQPALQAG